MSCGVALAVSLLLSDPNVATAAAQPLKGRVDAWIAAGHADHADFWSGTEFTGFKAEAADLAARDMQGHLILKERGTDGDLKCILRGISEDIPVKVSAVEGATSAAERRVALDELAYLLNDNVEVITAPPQPEV